MWNIFNLFTADCETFFADFTIMEIYDNITYGKLTLSVNFTHTLSLCFILTLSLYLAFSLSLFLSLSFSKLQLENKSNDYVFEWTCFWMILFVSLVIAIIFARHQGLYSFEPLQYRIFKEESFRISYNLSKNKSTLTIPLKKKHVSGSHQRTIDVDVWNVHW